MQDVEPQPVKSLLATHQIRSVAFFPDSERILTGHEDGSAQIWRLDTGMEDGTALLGHNCAVTSVAVLETGNAVITGAGNATVLLWSLDSLPAPRRIPFFSAPNDSQYSLLAFNSTNTLPSILACASVYGLVDVWEVRRNAESSVVQQINVYPTTITSLHFSKDNQQLLAIVCGDGKVRVADSRSGDLLVVVDGYVGSVWSLSWFPATTKLVAAAHKNVYIEDLQDSGRTTELLNGHTQTVKCVSVHPGGDYIVSGGGDKVLRIWDTDASVQIARSAAHPGAVTHISFSPDGRWIISVSGTKLMFLWNAYNLGIDGDVLASFDSPAASDPLERYFSQYPCFNYDPNQAATSEFYRMCSLFGWEQKTPQRNEAYEAFRKALTKQFNARYGTDVQSLSSWQLLCARLGVHPIPDTAGKCREIFCSTHVNLVDLVHGEGPVTTFNTVKELSVYSRKSGKLFPRGEAEAGGLLRYLLRHIFNPSKDRDRTAVSHSASYVILGSKPRRHHSRK